MTAFPGPLNAKGEGMIKLILVGGLLIGGGYYALKHFGLLDPAPPSAALKSGQPTAGSPAGAAVQGAEAAGDLLSSGR